MRAAELVVILLLVEEIRALDTSFEKVSSSPYFAKWTAPKNWAEKWADVNPLPTHLSARKTVNKHPGVTSPVWGKTLNKTLG